MFIYRIFKWKTRQLCVYKNKLQNKFDKLESCWCHDVAGEIGMKSFIALDK